MAKKHDCQGSLSGLNVIDFGWYYARPVAGMLLADQIGKQIYIGSAVGDRLLKVPLGYGI